MTFRVDVIDISHHQEGLHGKPIDFKAMADFGIRGIIHKASQGTKYRDPNYDARREQVKDAGLLWGAYHFNTGEDVKAQVENFFDAADPDDQTLMALDFEDYTPSQMSIEQAREFLELADAKAGRKIWIYTGNRFKDKIVDYDDDMKAFFGQHKLWLAQYGKIRLTDANGDPLPWDAALLHQFSGDGVNNQDITVPGIYRGNVVDMDMYNGDDIAKDWVT